jgi:hypothetical protein
MSFADALNSLSLGKISTAVDLTSVGNSAGTLTTLNSLTIPGKSFRINGDFLDFVFVGTCVSRATNVIRVDYAGTLLGAGTFASAPGGGAGGWIFEGRIARSGESSQLTHATLYTDTLDSGIYPTAAVATPSAVMDLDSTLTIKANGTNANDFVIKAAYFTFYGRTNV